MDNNRRLLENIRKAAGARQITVYQGIVKEIDGITCTCTFGSVTVSGIRLRASLSDNSRQMLIIPAEGTAVIVGSLSGDLTDLAVLSVDEVESIQINGGENGGMINIESLTQKINDIVEKFNAHTHTLQPGTISVSGSQGVASNTQAVVVPTISSKAQYLDKDDYEDTTITH